MIRSFVFLKAISLSVETFAWAAAISSWTKATDCPKTDKDNLKRKQCSNFAEDDLDSKGQSLHLCNFWKETVKKLIGWTLQQVLLFPEPYADLKEK